MTPIFNGRIRLFVLFFALLSLFCNYQADAQSWTDYPPTYPFGANGDQNHPDGYDGMPGDHPASGNPGHGGRGGDGWGDRNGGKGGDGFNGGDGGSGGNSGDSGGEGGQGGQGGDSASDDSRGGDGGQGGDGVDGGGDGGEGGDSPDGSAGDGGRGGNGTGDSRGGDGGDGGDSQTGRGGDAGDGGDSDGDGCPGDGGDGGTGYPGGGAGGMPGEAEDCNGDRGKRGQRYKEGLTLLPFGLDYLIGLEDLALIARNPILTLEDIVPDISLWEPTAGSLIGIAETTASPGPVYLDVQSDHILYTLALQPESINMDRLRVSIEMEVHGDNPLLAVRFGTHGEFVPMPSVPIPLPNGNMLREFTIVRTVSGEPFGSYLDLFEVEMRDCILRRFDVFDLGARGDLNFDQQVDAVDFGIVLQNLYQTGNIGVENGDTNLDGIVDSADASIVVEGMQD